MDDFQKACKELRAKGWSLGEIADFEERTIADVRKALKMDEPKLVEGDGLLPYLGI